MRNDCVHEEEWANQPWKNSIITEKQDQNEGRHRQKWKEEFREDRKNNDGVKGKKTQ
jgi:hypothetical protein